MKNLIWTFAAVFIAYVAYTTAAPATTENKEPARLEIFLARLAGPLKRLALEADALSKLVQNEALLGGDKSKRQGMWDMDYGLGGGRFGKKKRYDLYSFGTGRFGRDVDHVDIDHHGNQ